MIVVVLVVFVEAVVIAGYEVRKPRYSEFVAAVSVDVAPLLKEMLLIAVGAIVTGVVTGVVTRVVRGVVTRVVTRVVTGVVIGVVTRVVKRVVAGTDLNGYQGGK